MKICSIAASAIVCFLSLWATPSSAYERVRIYNHSLMEFDVEVSYFYCAGDRWRILAGKIKIENGIIVPSVSQAPETRGKCLIKNIRVRSDKAQVQINPYSSISGTYEHTFHLIKMKHGKSWLFRIKTDSKLHQVCGKLPLSECKYVDVRSPKPSK